MQKAFFLRLGALDFGASAPAIVDGEQIALGYLGRNDTKRPATFQCAVTIE